MTSGKLPIPDEPLELRNSWLKIKASGKLLGNLFFSIIGKYPSVSKSNRLHVVIFRFFFIKLRHIPWIPLNVMGNIPKPLTLTGYFSNSASSSVMDSFPEAFIFNNRLFLKLLNRFVWKVCETHIYTRHSWEEKWRTASTFSYLSPSLVWLPLRPHEFKKQRERVILRFTKGSPWRTHGNPKNDSHIERKLVDKSTIEGKEGGIWLWALHFYYCPFILVFNFHPS